MNPNEFTIPTGDEIREMRTEVGLNQQQLSNLSDVGAGTISNIENDRHGHVDTFKSVLNGLRLAYDIRQKAFNDQSDTSAVDESRDDFEPTDEPHTDDESTNEAEEQTFTETVEESGSGLDQLFDNVEGSEAPADD